MNTDLAWQENYRKFENLYSSYAPKIYGFIKTYTDTKEQSEWYMEKIFEKVWKDINYFDSNEEPKLLSIVLSICKGAIKAKQYKHQILPQ